MNKEELPPFFDNNFESIYGNFGARFAALLLDGLILAPLTLFVMIWNGLDMYSNYYTFPITLFVMFFYMVFLPVKYGATPGKRLMGLRILKTDGDTITYKDTFLRYLPNLVLGLIGMVSTLIAIQYADEATYNELKWVERSNYLMSFNSKMYYSQMTLTYSYFFTNLIIFLSNIRNRSISDFSGDTVVVYDRFMNKIDEFRNPKPTE